MKGLDCSEKKRAIAKIQAITSPRDECRERNQDA